MVVAGMKVRESSMPCEPTWESFFSLCQILSEMGLEDTTSGVAEFGVGMAPSLFQQHR